MTSSDPVAPGLPATVTARQLLRRMSREHGGRVFLITPEDGVSRTFGQIESAAARVARRLAGLGLRKSGKVACLLDNGQTAVDVLFGAMHGAFVPVPLDPSAAAFSLGAMLDHSGAEVLVAEERTRDAVREALVRVRQPVHVVWAASGAGMDWGTAEQPEPELQEPSEEDEALLDYTSGSTGRPKGVLVSHRNVLAGAWNTVVAHGLEDRDRSLCVLPLWHMNAQVVTLLSTLMSGGSVVLPRRFLVAAFWDRIRDHRCTWSALTPSLISQLLHHHSQNGAGGRVATGPMRFARSSSAPLAPELHRQFEQVFSLPLIEAMGSTEAGGAIFSNPVPPAERRIGSPGLPIGFEARIIDSAGMDLPAGAAGEIVVRGPSVMMGYHRDPEATGEVLSAEGWLRTGDLGWRDGDGFFFIAGRAKEIIIKGGENIAPREIDEVLLAHPAVAEAAAVGVQDAHLGEDIVAFAVLKPGRSCLERELQDWCEGRLGGLKTPSRVVILPDLPRGPTGKIGRHDLARRLHGDAIARRDPIVAGAGFARIEALVLEAWRGCLRREVGPDDNFFALGGHSLLAMALLARLRRALNVSPALSFVFEHPTVARQAAALAGLEKPVASMVPRRDRSRPCLLSPVQERIWFQEQLLPGLAVYNETRAVRLQGAFRLDLLGQALDAIVARHEMLRTLIQTSPDGIPHQVVLESLSVTPRTVQCAGGNGEVQRILEDEARRPFDLGKAPLFRVTVIETAPDDRVLCLVMHHMACDGWSVGVFFRELSQGLRALLQGASFAPASLAVQYADVATWQRLGQEADSSADDVAWWAGRLRGAPEVLDLPADRPRPAVTTHEGTRLPVHIGLALLEKLRALSRREGVTLFTTIAAAFQVLLFRYTGRTDILLGLPTAQRDLPELEPLIGCLINTQVLRVNLSGDPPFIRHLHRVDEALRKGHARRGAPFEKVVEALQLGRRLNHEPLVQVMLNWRAPGAEVLELDDVRISPLPLHTGTSKFDLTLALSESAGGMQGDVEFSTALFDPWRIERMMMHLETLLAAAADVPDAPLSSLPLLPQEERQRLLVEWQTADVDFPGRGLHRCFEEQAARTPDAAAILCDGEEVSYAALRSQSDRISRALRAGGLEPGALVAICLERGPVMIAAWLAVVKCGAAYLPLDAGQPADRLAAILDDAAPGVILTDDRMRQRLPGHRPVVIIPDDITDGDAPGVFPHSGSGSDPDRVACVIYTSGSTGKPKGVEITHRAIEQLVRDTDYIQLGPDDGVAQAANCAFDAATFEIWGALLNGSRLVLVSTDDLLCADRLQRSIERDRISVLFLTTALFNNLAQARPGMFSGLRHLLFGGEASDPRMVAAVLAGGPPQRLLHVYGPTETTTFATWHLVTGLAADALTVPIGRPIARTQAYVLDAGLQPVPVGVPGELHIGGAGLARGYRGDHELTGARFIPHPFRREQGARLYRTGDLVRWRTDGSLEFLNRLDAQVKIRGFRVEPAEIEAVLARHPSVSRVAVTACGEGAAQKRLVAFVVPRGTGELPRHALQQLAKVHLPVYMIPSAYVPIDGLPLTSTGKVDRRALAARPVTLERGLTEAAELAPVEEIIASVWCELLGIDGIGRSDNFFDLGGHSLLATQIIARLRRTFGVDLTVRSLFEHPVVAALADHIERMRREEAGLRLPPLVRMPRDQPLPVSWSQERVWRHNRTHLGNLSVRVLVIAGALDAEALRRALAAIVRRHEALRTLFHEFEGGVWQTVLPAGPFSLPVIVVPEGDSGQANEVVVRQAQQGPDLEREPPFFARLLRLGGREHWLVLGVHHIVYDAGSLDILLRELALHYELIAGGESADLADPPQLADFAAWQRDWMRRGTPVFESQVRYWKGKLSSPLRTLRLPSLRASPCDTAADSGVRHFELSVACTRKLEALSRRAGVTLFMTLVAAFKAVVARLTGQRDIVVGTYVSGRHRAETHGVFGCFLNLLALRTDLSGDPSFAEVLVRVRESALDAFTHQDIPFEELVAELLASGGSAPDIHVICQFIGESVMPAPRGLRLRFRQTAAAGIVRHWRFTLNFRMIKGSLVGEAYFDVSLHDPGSVERLLEELAAFLESAAADCGPA